MSMVSVVVGVDGTERSDHALSFAVGLAARERARLSACFVSKRVVVYPAGVIVPDDAAYVRKLKSRFNYELERADVGGDFYHRNGDIVDELKRLADEQIADVIAVGRSRHPHLSIGSVPRRLLDISSHAVLIVP
jgi:nucleotide-binding universal stress UspA family protein